MPLSSKMAGGILPVEIVASGGYPVRQVDGNGVALDDGVTTFSNAKPVIVVSSLGVTEDLSTTYSVHRQVTVSSTGHPVIRVDGTGNVSIVPFSTTFIPRHGSVATALSTVSLSTAAVHSRVGSLSKLLASTTLTSNATISSVQSPLYLGANFDIPAWYTYMPILKNTALSYTGAGAGNFGGFIGSTTGLPIPDANRDSDGYVKSLPGGEAAINFVCQLPPTQVQRRLSWVSKLGGSNHGCATMTMLQGGSSVSVDLVNRTVTYTPTNVADGLNSFESVFSFTPVSATDYPISWSDRPVTDDGAVATSESAALLSNVCSSSPVMRFMKWTSVERNNSPVWLGQSSSPSTSLAGKTISSITFVGTTATVTTATAHGLLGNGTGSGSASVTHTGATPSTYNVADAYVKVISPTQYQYTMAGTPSGNATVMGIYKVGDFDFQFSNLHYPSAGSEPGTQLGEPIYTSTNRNKNLSDGEWHDGTSVENIISASTAFGVNPWYCAPWNTDSTFNPAVAALFATFAAAQGKDVYAELSNEVWNNGYKVFQQARYEASLRGTLGDALTACRLVATSNITLSGAQSIDGIAVATSDRILVTGQTTASQNGVYVASTAGAWSRAADTILNRSIWLVTSGLTSAQTSWFVATTGTITLGTTALTITQINTRHRYAEKLVAMADDFIAAFASAGASSRLKIVAAYFNDGSVTGWDDMLAFVGSTNWAKITHYAVAPYYGDNSQMGIASNYTGSTATLKAAIITDQDRVLTNEAAHLAKAVAHGKKLIEYETGPTTVLSDHTYKVAFWTSSDAYDLELRFLQRKELLIAGQQTGGMISEHYSLAYPLTASNEFSWGLVSGLTQTVSLAANPKAWAHKQFLGGIRVLSDIAGPFRIPFGATNGSTVGTAVRSAYGSTLSLSNTAGGLFAINNTTGVVTVANSGLITVGNSYTLAIDEQYGASTHTTTFSVLAGGNSATYSDYRVLCLTLDGGAFSIAELSLAETLGGTNVALGQTYSDSSHFDANSTAVKAFDSDLATAYTSGLSNGGVNEWLRVTLSSPKAVNEMKLTCRDLASGASNQTPRTGKLQASANGGSSWVDIISFSTPNWGAPSETRTFTT